MNAHEPPSLVVASSSVGTTQTSAWTYITLVLANASLFAVYGGVLQILLPEQVTTIVGSSDKVSALAVITGIGAVVSVVTQPLAGMLSDRTRSPLGRRNSWIFGGAIATAIALVVESHVSIIALLVIAWCAVQALGNCMQAALLAVLPERTPISQRGTISGVLGIATILGMFVGVIVAGLGGSLLFGYVVIAIMVFAFGTLFALTTKDVSPQQIVAFNVITVDLTTGTQNPTRLLASHWRDYWWAFAGRFALFLAYQSVQGYLLFILSDYIHLGTTEPGLPIDTAIVILSGISTFTLIITAGLAGWLSDKVERMKPFVFWASAGFAVPFLLILIAPFWPVMLVAQALTGITFGVYVAVNQALMTRVIPNLDNAARDLGIFNITVAGPQAIAPFMAYILITKLGGYQTLLLFGIVFALIGAFCVQMIRSVR